MLLLCRLLLGALLWLLLAEWKGKRRQPVGAAGSAVSVLLLLFDEKEAAAAKGERSAAACS